MPVSTRIIRVLDNQYTLEIELEVDGPDDLLPELCKTVWGKKIAYLLSRMLPEVPVIQTEDQKIAAQKEEERIKKHEEDLIEKGRKEIRTKYYSLEYSEIQRRAREEAEEKLRKKYLRYMKEHVYVIVPANKDKAEDTDGCYGNYDSEHPKCADCASRQECEVEAKRRKQLMNQAQEQDIVEIVYDAAKERGRGHSSPLLRNRRLF